MVLAGFTSWSQCETNVSASDTLICPGDSVQISAGGPANPLTTTFAAGNNHRGNMFDIVAINNVTIQSFDATQTVELNEKTSNKLANNAICIGSITLTYFGKNCSTK